MNWKVLIGGGLIVAPLIFILAKSFGTDPHAVPFMLTGKPAPAFELQRLDDGSTATLEDFAGKPLLLNFWASWCIPCKREHPVIEWGQQKFGDKVQFLGVVYEDSEENVREYLQENPSQIPQLLDPKGKVAVDYALAGVPETYFIDKSGTIVHKYIGPLSPQVLVELLSKIADLRGGQ